jgi:hypothetical protein
MYARWLYNAEKPTLKGENMVGPGKHGDFIPNSQLWNFAHKFYGNWQRLGHRSLMHCLKLILSHSSVIPADQITNREVVEALAGIVIMILTNNPSRLAGTVHALSTLMVGRTEKRMYPGKVAAIYAIRHLQTIMHTDAETRTGSRGKKVMFRIEPTSADLEEQLRLVFTRAGRK